MTTRRTGGGVRTCGVIACLGLCTAYVLAKLLMMFAAYDDEGFMLYTVRQWLAGVPLYDSMYTEYGPAYYWVASLLHWISGAVPTHDTARMATAVAWLMVASGFGACVLAWGGSFRWALATTLSTTVSLGPLNGEPGHPQGLIWALLALMFNLFVCRERLQDARLFGAIGALVAGITLMKVNVGLFCTAALGIVFLTSLWVGAQRRWVMAAAAAGAAGLPLVLMTSQLTQGAAGQAALAAFALGSVVATLARFPVTGLRREDALWAATGYAVTSSALIAATLGLGGTSLQGLVDGVVRQPLRFSRAIPFQPPDAATLIAACLCASAGAALFASRNRRPALALGIPTTVAAVVVVLSVLSPVAAATIGPTMLWLCLLPGNAGSRSTPLSVALVVSVAAFCSLVVFPVPGTQSYLAATLVALSATAVLVRDLWSAASRAALVGILLSVGCVALVDGVSFALVPRVPSGLPGAQWVTLTPDRQRTFREVIELTSRHCRTLATLPGMNSFNLWANLPRPNGFATSAAMVLFDRQAQSQLAHDLRRSDRPCVIVNSDLVQWTSKFRTPQSDRPFMDLVHQDLVPVYRGMSYEIRVPRADAAAW